MNICIIGVGNIGMRYVQGISKSHPDAQLYLVDNPARLKELEKLELRRTTLCASLDDIDRPIDLFVVSTSCEPRLSIYKQCLALKPKYIILEKYLFKSREEFSHCLELSRVPTFVNQWMYGSKTFDCLFENEAESVDVTGSGWGLACNSVHWMDVMKRHLNITHLKVGTGTTVTDVFPSKRAGYEEISGVLEFVDKHSEKRFRLIDRQNDSLTSEMKIVVDQRVYTFDFTQILEGQRVLSQFPYFSDQIGGIVGELFMSDRCHLPTLEESISQHLLIEDILGELNHRPVIT